MTGRRIITRDMIIAARDKGWSVSLTAQHYGMHRSSIDAACERFGIMLPMNKFSPTMPSKTKPKPEGNPVWSCSPAAIEKALAKMKEKSSV
jgi:hypothetical protein